MLDHEPLDVDGDEFDNDQSLLQKSDPNYNEDLESDPGMEGMSLYE